MTVTGHEDEFRRLFEQEAGSRLGTLAERAMELESRRDDRGLVAEMFRDAHTLKGGASVVGFEELAGVVHELEQLLEELRSGSRTPDGALVDGVLAAVDALREMVARAMAGTDSGAAAQAVRAALERARGDEAAEASATAAAPTADAPSSGAATASPAADAAPGAASAAAGPPDAETARATGEAPPGAETARAADAPPPDAETAPAADAPSAGPATTPRRDAPAPPTTGEPAPPSEPGPPGAPPPPARQARSTAPDEAIPVPVASLDDLVRLVGESAGALLRIGRLIEHRLGEELDDVDEYRELAHVLAQLRERTMRARMVSVATIAGPLRRGVRDISRSTGKHARWELLGEQTVLDRHVLEHLREPLVALVRNAVDHGIEGPDERVAQGKPREGVVRVHATQAGSDVLIAVSDDGRGIDVERVRARAGPDADAFRAIFDAGVSTAEAVTGVSGRGVGLDSVRTAVERLRGRIEVRSEPGRGTAFLISVPMTLAVLRCLLVRAGAFRYALPMHSTATAREAQGDAVVAVDGRPALLLDGEPVPLVPLAAALGVGDDPAFTGPAVILSTASGRHAFGVDELLGQRDVMVKDVGRVIGQLPLVAGASAEPDGSVMLVLDPEGLIASAQGGLTPAAVAPAGGGEEQPARILVVDDALTIRELQRSILERAGYDVATAVDGEDALRVLAEQPADLVLTDIEMPRMDGFALTEAIRARDETTPILILTSRAGEDDRRRGFEAGADRYLVKSAFDAGTLLAAVEDLLP